MKVIWITGASSGLGAQIAKQALEKGYTVVSLARSYNKDWSSANKSIQVYFDLTKPNEWDSTITRLSQEDLSPDVLINNAGFGLFKSGWELSDEEVEQMLAVNVTGLIQFSNRISQLMIKKEEGHIIQVGSQAGKLATVKASVYAATKHAVIGYSNGLRLELMPHHVYVSVVNPGPIRTPFLATADPSGNYEESVGRWLLKPEYVAKKVVSLIEKPKRELNIPWWMNVATKAHSLSPSLFERLTYSLLAKK